MAAEVSGKCSLTLPGTKVNGFVNRCDLTCLCLMATSFYGVGGSFSQSWAKQPDSDSSCSFCVYLFLKLKSLFFASAVAFLP